MKIDPFNWNDGISSLHSFHYVLLFQQRNVALKHSLLFCLLTFRNWFTEMSWYLANLFFSVFMIKSSTFCSVDMQFCQDLRRQITFNRKPVRQRKCFKVFPLFEVTLLIEQKSLEKNVEKDKEQCVHLLESEKGPLGLRVHIGCYLRFKMLNIQNLEAFLFSPCNFYKFLESMISKMFFSIPREFWKWRTSLNWLFSRS